MNSKHLGGDVNYAWANSEIAVMGAEGAVNILYREEAKDPTLRQEKIAEYKSTVTSPFIASARGYLDDIIRPQNTRWRICKALRVLKNKSQITPWKKHDNLPL
jgi:propionyl-CoA carboxylase beta chain